MKKFGETEKPVVMEKPSHHKEVQSYEIPGDEQGYYRAYEGNKMVLVPKENLEAMKELVNYKMRRRAESTFTKYRDDKEEKKELERFQHKLEHLQVTMKDYETKTLEPLLKEYGIIDEAEHKFKKSEVALPTEFKKSEVAAPTRRTEPSIPSIKSLDLQQSSIEMSQEITLPRASIPDTKSIKFIISGHFRNNKKPLFIVRQYRGSSVIGDKTSDFNSSKTEKGVDVLISGKFYQHSILEEADDSPKKIRFKPHKKILIDDRSTVLEEGFIDLFSICEFDVVVGGMFVKARTSPHYTPLVSITIKKFKNSDSRIVEGRFTLSQDEKMVLPLSTPSVRNPFVQDLRKTQSDPKSGVRRRRKVSWTDHKPQGFKSLLTRIDEGEETFECPPRVRSPSKSSTSTKNSCTQKTDDSRKNFTLLKMFKIDYFNLFKRRELTENDGPKHRESFRENTTIALRDPIAPVSKNNEPNKKYISLPSTSQSKPHETDEEEQVVSLFMDKPMYDKIGKESKSSTKPGFFRRIFKKLFTG